MFTSFTGSARPRRQVNLSGRNTNPFVTAPGSRQTNSSQQSQNAVAHAQQERVLRQQERARPPAATRIQRTWRGYRGREEARGRWQREWDEVEARYQGQNTALVEVLPSKLQFSSNLVPYESEAACLGQLRLLIQFASPQSHDDVLRLHLFARRYLSSLQLLPSAFPADVWIYPLLRLAKISIATLKQAKAVPFSSSIINDFLSLLSALSAVIPKQISSYSQSYFKALAEISSDTKSQISVQVFDPRLLEMAILGLLQPITAGTITAYEGFISEFLVTPHLSTLDGSLDRIAANVNYKIMASAVNDLLSPLPEHNLLSLKSRDELLWLLAYFIYFRYVAHGHGHPASKAPDAQYVNAVSTLISHLADDIGSRIDLSAESRSTNAGGSMVSQNSMLPLPDFVRDKISTLVDQENVSSLLAHLEVVPMLVDETSSIPSQASALASYALTLLRSFPRRADEIRMWLYLGSTSRNSIETGKSEDRLPAIKYFFEAARRTSVYSLIREDPNEAVGLLRSDSAKLRSKRAVSQVSESTAQQWRVILLFLELYTFVLKVMDDEEFLSGSSPSNFTQTWTRQSALPLEQVQDLTVFLKNLGFSMYWNASEIAGVEPSETKNTIADYFSGNIGPSSESQHNALPIKPDTIVIAGVPGMTMTYMKGMITGLLRMVYERDSRRKFLPQDHWLMTKLSEMDRFISAVVAEEEHKHKIQESYDTEADEAENAIDEEEMGDGYTDNLVGTHRTQQVRNFERLKIQQRKTSRRKYLESVTPRLEILQNMPFFIPFSTRVQIFREFVTLDQLRRRGTADADTWRFAMMNSTSGNIGKHRAKVRRESIFDDAYEQFYELGEGLKEPIQIRFVDKFDTVEEGIDGGGVTKEFLTSVTTEAFSPNNDLNLFIENDQHLLYPNPSAVDERKDFLSQAGLKDGSAEWNSQIRDLLRRYEFLGRIIGKCLYEGILVDIHFAGFFLLKWALTGGSGSATKESSYRANINDLRDLDEGLYQGLLQLKNYSGSVEDFSLNFAVTDTISQRSKDSTQRNQRTITRELRPSGSDISVTNENRLVYISYVARHRLQIQPHLQTSAFLRGLGTIISPSWLSMFNQTELQTLVGGDSSEIDVSDLRHNTLYGGLYTIGDDNEEHPSVKLFWQAVQSFSDVDRRKLLKFVTSTPRAPLLGFAQLNPRFSIRDSGSDQTRLPSTSTCVNLLKLPVYESMDTLRDRLLYSINAGAGFNLS